MVEGGLVGVLYQKNLLHRNNSLVILWDFYFDNCFLSERRRLPTGHIEL